MFTSRLDEARKFVTTDLKSITPNKQQQQQQQQQQKELKVIDDDKKSNKVESIVDSKSTNLSPIKADDKKQSIENVVTNIKRSDIMEKLSEYLFDLFDANCMADFHRMEEFELRALDSFVDFNAKEYTHEQYQLHDEFHQLFENLIEKFLRREGYEVQEFYTELVIYLDRIKQFNIDSNHASKNDFENNDDATNSKHPYKDELYAKEVYEVLCNYMQFEVWAEYMKDMAKQNAKFRTFRENLGSAVRSDLIDYSIGKGSAATAHRLNDCAK